MLQCITVRQKFGKKEEFTGYDGSKNWKIVHDEMRKIGCPYCKEKGIKLMQGVHDSVNVHLGKKVIYPQSLNFLAQHVAWSVGNR